MTAGAHIPIIAMTAHATTGYQEFCLQSGMDGYIPKPININLLISAIDQVIPHPADQIGQPQPSPTGDHAHLQIQPATS